MNKKVIEAIVEEVDAVLSAPVTARGMDEALLIGSETRSEIKKLLQNYLAGGAGTSVAGSSNAATVIS